MQPNPAVRQDAADGSHRCADQMDGSRGAGQRTAVSLAGTAAEAARRGWHVFPVRPGDKRPAVDRWEQRACADPERVARHWPAGANIGIACGPSGLVVLDLDCHGELPETWRELPGIHDGRHVLVQLCEWAGQPWSSTYTVATPSGGWHMYYLAPETSEIRNSAGRVGPQVDVRAAGGFVVGAGSVVGGKPYELLDSQPPVLLPAWLARMLTRQPDETSRHPAARRSELAPGRLAGLIRTVETAAEGQRNNVLHWAACRLAEMAAAGDIDAGDAPGALLPAALAAGLDEREARRTITSALGGGR